MKTSALATLIITLLLAVAALFAIVLLGSNWTQLHINANAHVETGQASVSVSQTATPLQAGSEVLEITGTPPPPPEFVSVDGTYPLTLTVVEIVPFATLPSSTPPPLPPPTSTPLPTISPGNTSPFASQNIKLLPDDSLNSLTAFPVEGWDARWSPDGKLLLYSLFMSPHSDEEYHVGKRPLILADPATGRMEEVAKGFSPIWSPTGQYALFQYWDVVTNEQGFGLLAIPERETVRVHQFSDKDVVSAPIWVSGEEVLFDTGPRESSVPVLLNVRTRTLKPLVSEQLSKSLAQPGIQLPPSKVGTSVENGLLAIGSTEGLLVLAHNGDVDVSGYSALRTLPGIGTGIPIFSPTGDALAYLDREAGLRIVSVSDATKDDVVVDAGRNSWPIVWSTDGASLLFANRMGVQIVNRDGSGHRVLSELPPYAFGLQMAGNRLSYVSSSDVFSTFVVVMD